MENYNVLEKYNVQYAQTLALRFENNKMCPECLSGR